MDTDPNLDADVNSYRTKTRRNRLDINISDHPWKAGLYDIPNLMVECCSVQALKSAALFDHCPNSSSSAVWFLSWDSPVCWVLGWVVVPGGLCPPRADKCPAKSASVAWISCCTIAWTLCASSLCSCIGAVTAVSSSMSDIEARTLWSIAANLHELTAATRLNTYCACAYCCPTSHSSWAVILRHMPLPVMLSTVWLITCMHEWYTNHASSPINERSLLIKWLGNVIWCYIELFPLFRTLDKRMWLQRTKDQTVWGMWRCVIT